MTDDERKQLVSQHRAKVDDTVREYLIGRGVPKKDGSRAAPGNEEEKFFWLCAYVDYLDGKPVAYQPYLDAALALLPDYHAPDAPEGR